MSWNVPATDFLEVVQEECDDETLDIEREEYDHGEDSGADDEDEQLQGAYGNGYGGNGWAMTDGIGASVGSTRHDFENGDTYSDTNSPSKCPNESVRERSPLARVGQRGEGSRGRSRASPAFASKCEWIRGDELTEVYRKDGDVPCQLAAQVRASEEAEKARLSELANKLRHQDDSDEDEANEDATELFEGDQSASHFEWSSMDTYVSTKEQFCPKQIGPIKAKTSAYDAFRAYWDDQILSHIVTETNRHAALIKGASGSFANSWYDTNVHEILILFCFWIMVGIIRMPSIRSCFSSHKLLRVNIFSSLFSLNRYVSLCRALHFVDSSTRTPESSKLFLLGPLVDFINGRFQSAYTPSQNICIAENFDPRKAKPFFKQYITTHIGRHAVNTYELYESSTGYVWSIFIDTGKENPRSRLLRSTEIVLHLVKPLLNRSYSLFMNQSLNSPILARFLKRNGTDCVGMLSTKRANVPRLVALTPLNSGEYIARHSGDITVLSFQDDKRTIVISTWHGMELCLSEAKPGYPAQWKPRAILAYEKGMGGIDRIDQMLEPYLQECKRFRKWYTKFLKRFLNYTIHNSRILYQTSTKKSTIIPQHAYRLQLVDEILNHHLESIPKIPRRIPDPSNASPSSGHWPKLFPKTEGSHGRTIRKRCMRCNQRGIRSQTIYFCSNCNAPLCLDPCFELYHTEEM